MPNMRQNIWRKLNEKRTTTCQTSHHHRKPYAKRKKWHEWTEEEKELRGCRLRTLLKHNQWGEMQEQAGPNEEQKRISEHLQETEQNKQIKTINTMGQQNIWEKLGFIQHIPGQIEMWQRQIENCAKQSNSPDNLAKHLAKTRKDKITIKISRQKAKCPLCNIEYSNAIALLMHLEMTSANMTWKPMKCEILTANIIPPEHDNINKKWQLIQEHNTPQNHI